MSKLDVQLHKLETLRQGGYWAGRIYAQIKFGAGLSRIHNGKYDELLEQTADELLKKAGLEGCISMQTAREAEARIACMQEAAKDYTLICVSHAHIDMNWMWRFDETVAVTLDTFRTMLDLMKEYPEFTFSQSQASVYKIVEDYGPAGMLDEIAKRAQEGRWEVTASTWVEADKNTPNGESMARHLLYTRRYLSKLLGIPGERMNMDFEPDTFGHSANVPEILSKGDVRHYYHCRGSLDPQLVWWKAPSGAKVLVFRDAMGYNAIVDETLACQMLEPCRELGIDTMLRVYGVGDHGGGPSRRDIERIMDMRAWPVYPTIRFGTYNEFFSIMSERFGDKLPVRDEEMNFVFTGCYTTQTRIKLANRIGEATLNEAELFSSYAALESGFPYPTEKFGDAWKKILFNQFHDILTGSGIIDTREYAMGQFQQTMAAANTSKLNAMRAIAGKIDTSRYIKDEPIDMFRNEGAGVGKGIVDFKISQVDRSSGSTRVYHFFNAASFDRSEAVELTVWDWPDSELELMEFHSEKGDIVPHQLMKSGTEEYWGHQFATVLLKADVPACGYATYTLQKSEDRVASLFSTEMDAAQCVEEPHEYVLENDFLRAEFDVHTGVLVSLMDKKTRKEMIGAQKGSCGFRLVEEDTDRGMASWRVGRHMNLKDFSDVHIKKVPYYGEKLREAISIETKFSRSTLKVIVALDYDSPTLKYFVECDWHELGKADVCIPQLNFYLPTAYPCAKYKYDVPMGTLDRAGCDMDLPGNSFIVGMPAEGTRGIMLSSDTKYGFRGVGDSLSLDLIRSAYEPDPCPEYGIHHIKLAVSLIDVDNNRTLIEKAYGLWHPLNSIASPAHKGELPMSGSFLSLCEGNAAIQAIKMPEDGGKAVIVRMYETAGCNGKASFTLSCKPVSARLVNLHEVPAEGRVSIEGNTVTVDMPAYQVVNVLVEF